MKNLAEYCLIYSGYAFKKFNESSKGQPIIKIGNIQSDGTLDLKNCVFSEEIVHDKYKSKRNDIYIALSGATTGKVGLMATDEEFLINQRVGIVRLKNNDLPVLYLKYYLTSKTKRILADAIGSAQPNISPKQIEKYYIKDISFEKMSLIAQELDLIAGVMVQKQKYINSLDELIKSRFVEMFGDPIVNSKGFPVKKVIDVVTLQRGFDLPVQSRNSGNIPVYGSNGILGFHDEARIEKGIITGRSGTIGTVYISEAPFWPLNTTLFSNDTHDNNLVYLQYLLIFYNLKRFSSGTGVPTLNRNDFHNEPIISVPIKLQNEFGEFVKQVEKAKSVVKKQIADLQELLDSKMDEYFG